MEVICIVGLPGSGKTTTAKSICQYNDVLLDDIKNINDLYSALRFCDRSNGKVIITDPNFCILENRKSAENILKFHTVRWIFFENDPVKCLNNVKHRDDGRPVEESIKFYTKRYDIPKDVKPSKIWQNTNV